MKKLIMLFILILFGSLNPQSYDLLEWYRVYETRGYMNVDSANYVKIDLRLYPPEFEFYDDTTITKCYWKLCVWFYQKEKSALSGITWVLEYTETYGNWLYSGPGRMYLVADSLRIGDDIVWYREEGDGTTNSYFLYDHGTHYDLKVLNLETRKFVNVASFLK